MHRPHPIKATIKTFTAIVKQAETELKKMRIHLKKLHGKAKAERALMKKKSKKKSRSKPKKSVKSKVKATKKRKSSKKK